LVTLAATDTEVETLLAGDGFSGDGDGDDGSVLFAGVDDCPLDALVVAMGLNGGFVLGLFNAVKSAAAKDADASELS
jgi:hypothetical protein